MLKGVLNLNLNIKCKSYKFYLIERFHCASKMIQYVIDENCIVNSLEITTK